MIDDAAQHVGKPVCEIDTVEFRRGDQGVYRGGALSPAVAFGSDLPLTIEQTSRTDTIPSATRGHGR